MKNTKRILTPAFAATLAAALVFTAAPALAEENHWAQARTDAYSADTTPSQAGAANYTAYFCTQAVAELLFGGGLESVEALADYLAGNYAACLAKLAESAGEVPETAGADKASKLTIREYANGYYGLKTNYSESLAAIGSRYLAMIFYGDGSSYGVRVLENDAEEIADYGNALFSSNPLDSSGAVSEWKASSVSVKVGKIAQRYPWNGVVDVPFQVRNLQPNVAKTVKFTVTAQGKAYAGGETNVSAAAGGKFTGSFAIDLRALNLPADRGEATVKAEIVTE